MQNKITNKRDTYKDSKNSAIKRSDLQPEFCAKTQESDC